MTCQRLSDKYVIQNFNSVSGYTQVAIIFDLKSKLTASTPTHWYIQTWLDRTQPFTAHDVDPTVLNEIDYYCSYSGNT